jgi:pantothenate kinase
MATATDVGSLGRLLTERARAGRILCGIAGPPGSGKSTLAEELVAKLNAETPGMAALLPMDGFHYDDAHLRDIGLHPRKGSPETFDVGGLVHLLGRLKSNAEAAVAVPVFDRDLEIARAGARLIPSSVRIVVVEGNYLLLRRRPWDRLRGSFDVTVMIEVPEDELRRRLTARWEGYGLNADQIAWKLDGNDLPNGRAVTEESVPPEFVIR